MSLLDDLNIKIFADGADLDRIKFLANNPLIKGFTTNPTLMKQAGITDYKKFALEALKIVDDRPFSFEVFADDFPTMKEQALEISSWGDNVNVKIPITNTKGESSCLLINDLSSMGVKINVTAIMSKDQIYLANEALNPDIYSIISIFSGRIADTGIDPMPIVKDAVSLVNSTSKANIIWASPRELLNLFQANDVGCHIITVTNDILKKLDFIGKDLEEFSLDTVKMFYNDALSSDFKIDT
jgi:transaldolase